MTKHSQEIPTNDAIETELMVEAVFLKYGHDFRDYARPSLIRRFLLQARLNDFPNIGSMIAPIIRDEELWKSVFEGISVNVSELFRDPSFFLALKTEVFPVLATYPRLRIWHAGCALGEEVYSLAILLKEANLLDRCTIFATDFNDVVLDKARSGIFPLSRFREWSAHYQQAGGKVSLSEYFVTQSGCAKVRMNLQKRITFANHNLVTDRSFGEMHLILCRNVFIYFNKGLQDRVLKLLLASLSDRGFLALGSRESIHSSKGEKEFEVMDPKHKIFRKVADRKGGSFQ